MSTRLHPTTPDPPAPAAAATDPAPAAGPHVGGAGPSALPWRAPWPWAAARWRRPAPPRPAPGRAGPGRAAYRAGAVCLVIALSQVFDDVPLLLAGNRDERFAREAEPMASLRDGWPATLGGRDLVGGGTWLAVNEAGVVAALTNRPLGGKVDPARRSRGALPLALTAHATAAEAVKAFAAAHRPADYNPCWLLVGDRRDLFYVDMTVADDRPEVTALPPGVHVLENAPIDGASDKAAHVRAQLVDAARLGPAGAVERLRAVLADHRQAVPAPAVIVGHGDGRAEAGADAPPIRPPALTAACVHTESYGTRWSGIVTVPADPGRRPSVAYADGPPCTATHVVADDRWP